MAENKKIEATFEIEASSKPQIVQLMAAPEKNKRVPRAIRSLYMDKKSTADSVVFLSYHKELCIMYETPEIVESLHFANRVFVTNNASVIEYLRENSAIGKAYWEKEYPQGIKNKLAREENGLAREKEEHELG